LHPEVPTYNISIYEIINLNKKYDLAYESNTVYVIEKNRGFQIEINKIG
jgi:hypothetical protein